MAVAVYFHPTAMNEKQYRAVTDQLAAEGEWPPEGLVHHSCFGENDGLMVYEVWESQAALDAFGPHLMPVLQEQPNVPTAAMPWPAVMPVVNILP